MTDGQASVKAVMIWQAGSPGRTTAFVCRATVSFDPDISTKAVGRSPASGLVIIMAVVPGVEADTWIGLIAPAKVDPAILSRLARAAREALEEPAPREKLNVQYMEAVGNTPQAFRAIVQAEVARWKPVIRENGMRLD